MKGRNTTVISIRLGDDIVEILRERAKELSISECLRRQIIKGCSVNNNDSPSVNTTHSVITIPIYNKNIHKPGDRVRVWQGKQLVEMIVPEIDGDGYLLYNE